MNDVETVEDAVEHEASVQKPDSEKALEARLRSLLPSTITQTSNLLRTVTKTRQGYRKSVLNRRKWKVPSWR